MKTYETDYVSGWHPEEKDQIGPFRWMGKKAVLRIKDLPSTGCIWLQLTAGHPHPAEHSPLLTVSAAGQKEKSFKIEPSFSTYGVPLQASGELEVALELDKVPAIPQEKRELGIMVRNPCLLTLSAGSFFLEGWYENPPRSSSRSAFRWMKKEGSCLVKNAVPGCYLEIEAGHPFAEAVSPILTVEGEGRNLGRRTVRPGIHRYIFPVEESITGFELKLILDKTFSYRDSGDSRDLGIQVGNISLQHVEETNVLYESGWQEAETNEFFPFRWMEKEAVVFLPDGILRNTRYVSFPASSEYFDFTQKLTVSLDGSPLETRELLYKWNHYCLPLPVPESKSLHELRFSLNKVFPEKFHPGDSRKLGIRVGHPTFHNEEGELRNFRSFHQNALLNFQEMLAGKPKLSSFPLYLGVDLYGKCNMKPPCVYCLWDRIKKEEGMFTDTVVDEKTLDAYGPFFHRARTIVNCSFGEPLLHPRFKEILEFCEKNKKFLEISSNGQSLSERTINALAGKPVFLYVSLDAASKETYAKIRSEHWDPIIPHLEQLNRERKKKNNLPKIFMVFMPMEVNRHELEAYFRLCQKIEADALVLRPLNYLENPQIEAERGGYHFDYEKELLKREDIEKIIEQAENYSVIYNVPLANQFAFGTIKKPGEGKKDLAIEETQRF
ncbi:MAG: radical SAM protein [Candidatus Aminicenantes bacterium]|nr:radical SAM protein [Candidatus Aminicenantes bacterium]